MVANILNVNYQDIHQFSLKSCYLLPYSITFENDILKKLDIRVRTLIMDF